MIDTIMLNSAQHCFIPEEADFLGLTRHYEGRGWVELQLFSIKCISLKPYITFSEHFSYNPRGGDF